LFYGTPTHESYFDITYATGDWNRVLLVKTPVNPALLGDSFQPCIAVTMVRFLTPGRQLVLELPVRRDRVSEMANFTEYGKDGFTEYGKDGIRIVAPMVLEDAAWQLLEATKLPTLIVETRVDLLMEQEGIVSLLGSTASRAVYDLTNASLIKSPRDAFSNVDPVVWVTERQNASGAMDHLVVIAFELWTRLQQSALLLEVNGHFAVNGQRFIEQPLWIGQVVDAADYVLGPRRDALFNPAMDPTTGLPIVDVKRTLVVRSFLIPDSDWKQIEAAMATGTVSVGMSLGLMINTGSGATMVDPVFLTGLAEPRPDPAWLLELLN
jgi:hypothetical protein